MTYGCRIRRYLKRHGIETGKGRIKTPDPELEARLTPNERRRLRKKLWHSKRLARKKAALKRAEIRAA